MTHTATKSPPNPHDRPSPPETTNRLLAALNKYRMDSDLESLRDAYTQYITRKEKPRKSKVDIPCLARALGSFNIAPSNSYKRYMAALKHKSGADAIRADWEAVGEHLSYAVIKHILLEKGQYDSQKK